MRSLRRLAALLAFAPLATGLAAQDPDPAATPASAQPPTPARPPTGRWLVMFRERDFDLSTFRRAVLARRPAADLAAIVADLERRAARQQADFAAAVAALGGRVHDRWWLIDGCCIEAPADAVDRLRRRPNVERIMPDRLNAPTIRNSTDARNHNSDWLTARGYTGAGVTAAILDSGFDVGGSRPHRAFYVGGDPGDTTGGGIAGSRVLHVQQIGALPPHQLLAHGTGVASVVAGAGWSSPEADVGHAPDAKLAFYSIADRTDGYSSDATDIASWQQLAADRTRFDIGVANNSYGGDPALDHPAQIALDAAAFNADILIAISAGNGGTNNGTRRSQSAANALAVAAIEHTTHAMASFSSRGPLTGQDRFYPDIAAVGRSVTMARGGDESGNYRASGTSFSSPQVAGAATLVRSADPALTALETKAVLLATAEDISAANPSWDRNSYGVGMLRDDFAVISALRARAGNGDVVSARVDPSNATWSQAFPARDGRTYRVAVTWHRDPNLSSDYADLDVEVHDGSGALIGASATPNNLYEFVSFVGDRSGTVSVRVVARSFQTRATAQDFAVAVSVVPGAPFAGSYTAFGRGCAGQNGVPRIRSSSRPTIGQSFSVVLDRGRANATAHLLTGFSTRVLGGFSLPLDLGPFGAPGCELLVSADVAGAATTDATGRATWDFAFPSDETLVGLELYQQAAVLDPGANDLGLVVSHGATLVLGNVP